MNGNVTVHQIFGEKAHNGHEPFFNVRSDSFGSIAVWGSCYSAPTYLLQDGANFWFVQFSNEKCAEEWFEEQGHLWNTVTEVVPQGKS